MKIRLFFILFSLMVSSISTVRAQTPAFSEDLAVVADRVARESGLGKITPSKLRDKIFDTAEYFRKHYSKEAEIRVGERSVENDSSIQWIMFFAWMDKAYTSEQADVNAYASALAAYDCVDGILSSNFQYALGKYFYVHPEDLVFLEFVVRKLPWEERKRLYISTSAALFDYIFFYSKIPFEKMSGPKEVYDTLVTWFPDFLTYCAAIGIPFSLRDDKIYVGEIEFTHDSDFRGELYNSFW